MSTFNIPPYAGIYDVSQSIPVFRLSSHSSPHWIPQVSLSSVTQLQHTASRTLLSQTFVNPSSIFPIDSAKYTFPLYESCAIVSFRCYVGTRLIEGVIKEKEEASATYHAAVDRHEPASLLEQQTPDVFSTSLGNIPPSETVRVQIEYIMELKHDAEVDGLRFTIPTSIAPRYGVPPSGLSADSASTGVTVTGIDISVEVIMSSNIQAVQSPSHPISVYLGGHTEDTPENAFNPQHALATLSQTSTELDKDFVLLIRCANLSSPSALLETHPTIPNSQALMLTLVPKFNPLESSKPEVVFVVDRSGSMVPRVTPLKSSLSVCLKSLPLGVNFNVCSFGSTHSFLWSQSQPYSHESFAEAQRHCDGMQANLGGTEILPAIKSTITRRFRDLNLEIIVLTDGQVWNSEELFQYVEKETAKGDVRVFSLGIGRDVSHSLIDGLARVGRGFSQVISDEREGMEGKVARMLRGGLSAHVLNYRMEWEGKPSEEDPLIQQPPSSSSVTRTTRRISLFDTHANADSPISFSTPPDFVVPSVLQAPYKLQPLFPFSRSTAYVILSDAHPPPSHVRLRGTTPAGDELELEIAVQRLSKSGRTIHQLAARKILQELKEGTGYLHGGRWGVSRGSQPGVFQEWVKKEGVRVGLKYGVASQWTSFVAVVREEEGRVGDDSLAGLDDDEEYEFIDGDDDGGDDGDDGGHPGANSGALGGSSAGGTSTTARPQPQTTGSVPVMMMMSPEPPAIPYPTKSSLSSKLFPHSLKAKSASGKGADVKSSAYSSYSKRPSHSWSSGKGSSAPYSRLSSSPAPAAYTPSSPTPFSSSPYFDESDNPSDWLSPPLDNPSGKGDAKDDDNASSWASWKPSVVKPLPEKRPVSSSSPYSSHSQTSSLSASPGKDSPTAYSSSFSSPKPPEYGALQGAPPSATSPPLFGSLGPPAKMSSMWRASDSLLGSPASSHASSGKGGDKGGDDKSKASFAAVSKYFSRPHLSKPHDNKWSSKASKFGVPDIAISYVPPSAPPAERLSSETGAQPLSLRTKVIIDLQTFEGSFLLDSALATSLGVSITILEERLRGFAFSDAGLSREHRRSVWATMLAIKLFETRLAGERSVWQLVVDKAKAWMRGLVRVGDTDIRELEKLAEEILGV